MRVVIDNIEHDGIDEDDGLAVGMCNFPLSDWTEEVPDIRGLFVHEVETKSFSYS